MSPSGVYLLARLELSGALDPRVLMEVKQQLSATDLDDAEAVAEELLRQGVLTPFQVRALLCQEPLPLMLGKYVLIDQVGEGGMGRVFKAQHTRLKRVVALKLLPQAIGASQEQLAQFRREVEVAGKLQHPNIVTAYDADVADGIHFLAMEFIPGVDLARLVQRHGPLSVGDALHCICGAARGLAYTHAQRIVHRDIKPANLMLGTDGVVRILDMGVAWIGSLSPAAPTAEDPIAAPMGTADFMAPEQTRYSSLIDSRSDIYSLGCTLHYLLTSQPLYAGRDAMARIYAHREQPVPSLCERRPDVPPQLDAIFQKMVAKRPEDRYWAAELIAALEACGVMSPAPLQTLQSEAFCSLAANQPDILDRLPSAGGEDRSGPTKQLLTRTGLVAQARRMVPFRQLSRAALAFTAVTALAVIPLSFSLWGKKTVAERRTDGNVQDRSQQLPRRFSLETISDANRAAALWVLGIGGTLQVQRDQYWQTVNRREELPPGSIRVMSIQLGGSRRVQDDDLAHLQGLADLQMIWLGGTPIGDGALVYLQGAAELRLLGLSATRVSDAGLVHLNQLPRLATLLLDGTMVSDKGLEYLRELVTLRELTLGGTAVTEQGIAELQAALPHCRIVRRSEL